MDVGQLRCFVLSISCDVQTAHAWTVLKYSGGFTSDNDFLTHLLGTEQRRQTTPTQESSAPEPGQASSSLSHALDASQVGLNLGTNQHIIEQQQRNGNAQTPTGKKHNGPGRPPREDKNYGHKAYKCDQCPKAFMYKSLLAVHYRKHSGEKPYQCRFCNKTFSQLGNCQKHESSCNHDGNNQQQQTQQQAASQQQTQPQQQQHPHQMAAMALTSDSRHEIKPPHAHSMVLPAFHSTRYYHHI